MMRATGISQAMTAPASRRRPPTRNPPRAPGSPAGVGGLGGSSTGCEVVSRGSGDPGPESPARTKDSYPVRPRLNPGPPSPPRSTMPRRIGSKVPRPCPELLSLALAPVTACLRASSREPPPPDVVALCPEPDDPCPEPDDPCPEPLPEPLPLPPPGFVAWAKPAVWAPCGPRLSRWVSVAGGIPAALEPGPLDVP